MALGVARATAGLAEGAAGTDWRLKTSPQYPTMMAATKRSPARPIVIRLFMTALPFLLQYRLVQVNEITSQSGSYEHSTIWLFEGSAANPKCHYA
jgi:hypothetical protein